MTIGDGVCDPVNQFQYGEFLYQLSLVKISRLTIMVEKTYLSLDWSDR
jgi:hypothetical protein